MILSSARIILFCARPQSPSKTMAFPTHVVCAWLGNSPDVAREHYLQTTDEHWKRARLPTADRASQVKDERESRNQNVNATSPLGGAKSGALLNLSYLVQHWASLSAMVRARLLSIVCEVLTDS
jgi:hypothetical protein